MAQIKCYDPQGNEYMKEPIDVKECIQNCGYSTEPPAKAVAAPVTEPEAPVQVPSVEPVPVEPIPVQTAPTPEPAKPWLK